MNKKKKKASEQRPLNSEARNNAALRGESTRQVNSAPQAPPMRRPQNRRAQAARPPQRSGRSSRPAVFDQASAPIPRPSQNSGSREIMLPIGAPAAPTRAPSASSRKPRRGLSPDAPQRRLTRGETRRRRFRKRLITFIILLLAISAGITLSVTVLFKIDNFVIEGNSSYSQEDILLAFGIPKEENIFAFKISEAEERMSELLPYTEEVKVRRRFPSTIVIVATLAQETYYTSCTDGGYAVLSEGLKVLRLSEELVQDMPFLKGIEPVLPKAGKRLEYPSEDKETALERTLEALKLARIDNFSELDVSNTIEISFLYDKRARVLLGTSNDLEDKLALAGTVLREQIGPAEHGILDVSHQSEDKGRQGVWTPGVS